MTKLTLTLAASLLAVSGAAAQEPPAAVPRMAPPQVRALAPALARYTDEVLFADVWRRAPLSPRDRSLVTVATLIANGRAAQLRGHTGRALENGVRPTELAEIITHLAFYAGWPAAMSAVPEVQAVFEQRGIDPATLAEVPVEPLPLDAASEARRATAALAQRGPVASPLAGYTDAVLFGDLWRRPALAPRDRSLVTLAALIANGQSEQLPLYVNRAMDAGLSAAEISEVLTHIAFYAGWPCALSAVGVVTTTLAERARQGEASPPGLAIQRHALAPPVAGPASTFTGTVHVASRFQAEPSGRVAGGVVTFQPGARTNWHTHPHGQTLVITAGQGWVQSEGGPVQQVGPGDVVVVAPGVRHWHGATATTALTHVAMAEAVDGSSTTWLEPVTEAQYGALR